jgi:hypothetical protein
MSANPASAPHMNENPLKPTRTRTPRWRHLGCAGALLAITTMSAPAAISFDAASSQSAGAGASIAWSHTVGSGNDRMLVVGVASESGGSTNSLVTGVTYGAQSLTQVPGSRAVEFSSSTYNATELWYLPAPAVGTATITINFSPNLVNGAECGAVSLFGVQQAAPEAVAILNAAGSGGTYSLAITTLTNGAWVMDVVNNGTGGATDFVPGASQTERWDRNASGQMRGAGSTREVATAGSVTDTWTVTGGTSRKAQSIAAFAPAPTTTPLAVSITSPANGATVGANYTINATAAVFPGTITSVDFYEDDILLDSDTTSPYSYARSGAVAGPHALKAIATDSSSATITSATVNITVGNLPPVVAVTSPAAGAAITAGANVTLTATATDDVSVASVEFFVDNVSVGSDTTSPYSATWNNASLGFHAVKAVATDNASLTTTSTVVNVSVVANPGFGALSFDGSDDYVTMGTAPGLGSQTFTLECWVKHDPSGTGRTTASSGTGGVNIYPLIGKGRGEGDGSIVDCNYTFGLQADGKLAADFEDLNNGLNHPIIGTNAVPANVWKHCAITYDGGYWRIYIDGVLDNSLQITGGGNIQVPRYDSIQHFGLGTAMTSAGATQGFYKGLMDEVRVWNYARSQTEIANNMYSEIASATGLLGRWSLNETSGTTVTNTGSNGGSATPSNGTLTNGPVRATGQPLTPAANQAPAVAITSPSNSATVFTDFTITATAADSDGSIASVKFYDGANLLATDTTAPYSYAWTGAAAGPHALTAVALDNGGLTTTSAVVNITVSSNQPPVIAATAPADEAGGIGASTTLSASIADPEGDATTVTFYGRKTTPLAPGPDFSVIAIPDTQFYSENTGRNPVAPGAGAVISLFTDQTQWIVNNRATRNIAFISHMGDIVQNGDFSGDPAEWIRADGAMKIIENQATTLRAYGIPWGGAPGNHDQSPIGDAGGTTTYFNQYFGSTRFAGRNYYGGHFGTNNNNNYQLFSASGLDFIIIHLEYDTRALASYQAVLDWADALLKAYPNRRAIVTSHWIINTGNPATFSTQGANIYGQLKDNPNLFLLLCGHVHGEGRRTDVFEGRQVHSVLQDYQDAGNGGNGFLRTFTFSPATNQITAEMWSPTLNRAATAADAPTTLGTFTLPYDMQSSLTGWIPLGTVNVAAGGSVANLNWTGLETGARYEWYATANDGIGTGTSATRRFTTTAPVPPTVALTGPAEGAGYVIPATIDLAATAGDTDGTVARVEFFDGVAKLGEDAAAPYEFSWPGVAPGSHALTAVAVDNSGLATLSAVVNVTVTSGGNQAPTVSLTSPASGATSTAPASINFAAIANDSDGTVAKVEFYQGAFKVGEDTTNPYTYAWTNVAPGSYQLSAVATDNASLSTTSATVAHVVNAGGGSGTVARGPYLQKAAPTQMTICWRGSQSVVGRVRYGTNLSNLNQFKDDAAAPASPFNHVITLTGLTANTTYFYSIGSATDILVGGADYTFTTPPVAGTVMPTRIWALGDAGTADGNQGAVRDAFYTWTGSRTPNLVLQLGDNAYNSGTDTEFQNAMFNMYPTMLRKTPFWSCLGNHETNQATAFVNTYPYFDIYTLPTAGECGGVASGTEHYFSFDHGNIHLISLDSMTADRSPTGAMATWLQNDLASTTATWIIAFFHHPPYTKGSHNSDTEGELIQMRANLLPILEAGGVDLVLCGHSHCYERSYLLDGHYGLSGTLTAAMKMNAGDGRPAGNGAYIKPLTGVRSHLGAVYAVAGSAGKISGGTLNHPAHFISMNNLGSLVLDVNGPRLDATFIRENSSIPDTFTILKQDATNQPTVTLGLTGSPLAEAAGTATVTATLSATHTSDVTVNLAFTGTATLTTDYTRSGTSITIPAGSTTGSVTLTAVQDAVYENPNETIVVDIASVTNGTESGTQQVTATITGDDPAPSGGFTENFDSMGGTTTLPAGWSFLVAASGDKNTWTASAPIVQTGVSMNAGTGLTLNDAPTASNNNGYNALGASGLTGDRCITTAPTGIAGVGIQSAPIPNTSGAAITSFDISYDIKRFTVGSAGAEELPGFWLFYSVDAGTTWTNVVALNPTLTNVPNTVGVTNIPTTTVTLSTPWANGANLLLRWVDDNAVTPSPDQIVGLDNVHVGYDSGPAQPTVTLGLTGSPLAEAAGVATVTATLSATYTQPVTVNLAFAGTATLTSDYTRSATSITIPAGNTTGTITLTAVQDSIYENPNETIVVDIDTVTNGTESGTQQVTATITDDDPVPTTTTLSTSGSPSTFGNPVTLTATVAPAPAGGTVQFYDNAVALGSPVAVSGGQAQLITNSLAAGSHPITAIFNGTAGYAGSTASVISQEVDKATPTITTAPTASAITVGQTLADSTLSGGAASVPGTFAFTTPSTAPGVGTAPQGVTFTPADTANYDNATTSVNVTVNPPADPFVAWISTDYPALVGADAEPGADPDFDGMTNQQEFAFGLDPTSGSSANPIAVPLDKTTGKFSYTRRLLTGLSYTVWTSPDLLVWTKDNGALEGTVTTIDDIETVPVTLSASLLGAVNLFIRVVAE